MIVEVHVLQNFAPSCLNRDDTNTPKDCVFGGYRRARISSQCIKRSIRSYCSANAATLGLDGHLGSRTQRLHSLLVDALVKAGKPQDEASESVRFALEGNGLTMKEDQKNKTAVLLFLDLQSVDRLKDALLGCWDDLQKGRQAQAALLPQKEIPDPQTPVEDEKKEKKKTPKKTAKQLKKEKAAMLPDSVKKAFDSIKHTVTTAADIALFGRMIVELDNMSIDAACQVAHAVSTHEVNMEADYYTAIDDLQPAGDVGAEMIGIVEFNSSCFYRYSLVDTAQLLANLDGDKGLADKALLGFVQASILAIPTGRQHSMAAQNLPEYVRVVVRSGGVPRSLTNAFLKPVRPTRESNFLQESRQRLIDHDKAMTGMYGVDGVVMDRSVSIHGDSGSVADLVTELAKVM